MQRLYPNARPQSALIYDGKSKKRFLFLTFFYIIRLEKGHRHQKRTFGFSKYNECKQAHSK